jgi:hypothetical protein
MADWTPLVAGLTALLSAVSAVLAWVAKLMWGKEFAAAKDATIKSLQDGREDLKQSMAAQLGAKDAEIEVWKEKHTFLERKMDEDLWKQVDNQLERQKLLNAAQQKQIVEQAEALKKTEATNRELQQLVNELPGKNENKAKDEMIARLAKQLEIQQHDLQTQLEDARQRVAQQEQALQEFAERFTDLTGDELSIGKIRRRWNVVIEELKRSKSVTTSALLSEAVPLKYEGTTLVIGFRFSVLKDKWDRGDHTQRLMSALASVFRIEVAVTAELIEVDDKPTVA